MNGLKMGTNASPTAAVSERRGLCNGGMALIALCLLTIGNAAGAQVTNVIYQDTFNRTRLLNGSSPDVTGRVVGNNVVWKAIPELLTDGTNISVAVPTPSPVRGVNQYNNAFLPFKPEVGHVYTLSVEIKGTYGDDNWLAFGFAQNARLNNYFAADNIGVGWLLQRANDAGIQVFQGPGTSGDDTFPSSENTNAFNKYNIVLDTTTGDAASGWTITFFQNGTELKQCVYSANPSIAYVGLGADGVTGYYRNFNLNDYAPAILTNHPARRVPERDLLD